MNELLSKLFSGQKSARTATLLSIVFGGLGQIYLGQSAKGLAIILASLLGLLFVLIPLGMIDAYYIGKRIENGEKVGDWDFFWHQPGVTSRNASSQKVTEQYVIDQGIELEETRRWDVPLNNRGNDSSTKITVTQNLTVDETIEFGQQQQEQTAVGGTLGASYGLFETQLKREASRTLQNHYRRSFGSSRSETRSIELSASPNTNMEFTLVIKHVWRRGEIVFKMENAETTSVAFRFREGAEIALVESKKLNG